MAKETTRIERITYSSFIGGQKLLYILISSYVTIFFISSLKLNIVFITILIVTTRIFDAINDPIIGAAIDKSKIKLKTYLKFTTILLPIATIMLFIIPIDPSNNLIYVYITVVYVLWSILYTIGEVPIYSIVSRMTNNQAEQDALLSKSMLGTIIASLLGLTIISYYISNGVDQINWSQMSLILCALAFLQMAITIIFIKERHESAKEEQSISILDGLNSVLKNRQLMVIMIIFTAQLFTNASSVLAIYVYDAYYNMTSLGSLTSIISMLAVIPLAFSLSFFISKIGKTWLIYISCFLMISSNVLIFILASSNLATTLVPILLVISAFGLVIPSLLRPLYTQETIEYHRRTYGKVNTSASFALMTLFNKAGDALGAGLGTILLIVVGFDESLPVEQLSSKVVDAMHFFWLLGPILMALVWFIGIKYFYKLKNVKRLDFDINPKVAVEFERVSD